MLYNHHIDTFLCVARLGSFSKAVDELHLTAAGIGKHIDDLERIIGRKLLDRGAKGVTLTEYGQHFYNECPAMIKLSEDITERVRFSGHDEVKPIRIGYFPLTPLDEFNRICLQSPKMSEFKTSVIQYDSNLNTGFTSAEPPEIGFGVEETVKDFPEIGFLPFSTQKLTCVVPAGHRLARKQKLSYDDLAGETLYFPSRANPGLTQRFCNYIRQNYSEITVNAPAIFYDLDVINRCAREDKILIGFDFWSNIHPGLVVLPVEWGWSAPYGVIWRKDARKEVLEFMEAFKEALEQGGYSD